MGHVFNMPSIGMLDSCPIFTRSLGRIYSSILAARFCIQQAGFGGCAVEINARHHAEELTYKSILLKEAVASGRVQIISAVHSLTTGEVRWLTSPNDVADDKSQEPPRE